MDLLHLQEHYPELLDYLKDKGYSNDYIAHFKAEINWVLARAVNNTWNSYQDIFLSRISNTESKEAIRQRKSIIAVLEQFDIRGAFPDSHRRNCLFPRGSYHLLVPEYQQLIDHYRRVEGIRGKKPTTIQGEALNTASFLYYLQENGCRTLSGITEQAAISFFRSGNGEPVKSCSYRKNISAVFKAGLSYNEAECKRILLCLPMLRERRKNIQYLTNDELVKLMDVLRNETAALSSRNRAVGLLLVFTGLRSCDIAALTLDSIDWQSEKICICQQKTGITVELPLIPLVGNAVYDYLCMERIGTSDNHLFLTENRPCCGLSSRSVGNIVAKIFRITGIRQEPGSRKGTHIFRHNLASSLLANGIPQPVISQTLGHTTPNSLEPYLRADFAHLKECALSIKGFPVSGEVFLPC